MHAAWIHAHVPSRPPAPSLRHGTARGPRARRRAAPHARRRAGPVDLDIAPACVSCVAWVFSYHLILLTYSLNKKQSSRDRGRRCRSGLGGCRWRHHWRGGRCRRNRDGLLSCGRGGWRLNRWRLGACRRLLRAGQVVSEPEYQRILWLLWLLAGSIVAALVEDFDGLGLVDEVAEAQRQRVLRLFVGQQRPRAGLLLAKVCAELYRPRHSVRVGLGHLSLRAPLQVLSQLECPRFALL
mmetsp:Transcript_9224/g.27489  ORF Transcript_9224/g.27489 Transcript_9224/m.27489 type:complete len:239 (+) Transcript_9224:1312-2028(+)